MPFKKSVTLRFHEADPAGIMYFANAYSIAHTVYEELIEDLGFTWQEWFENPVWAAPIRKSECEYMRPIRPNTKLSIRAEVVRVGDSSFTSKYTFEDQDGTSSRPYCEVTLVHAFLYRSNGMKVSIPDHVRERLDK
jgi:acyl-CoA thioesterase FadM